MRLRGSEVRGDDPKACYDAAIRLLNYRWRSRSELAGRLSEKDFEASVVEATLGRLDGEGWIDDERFAHEFARSKVRKDGPHRIARALREFGVERSLAHDAAFGMSASEEAEAALRHLARRKLEAIARKLGNALAEGEVGRRKLAEYLFGRGYDRQAIDEIVAELWKEGSNRNEDYE